MTLGEALRQLRQFDEEPVSWQEPSIYAEEPLQVSSSAVVEWSMPKGGLPAEAAKQLLYYFVGVRKALDLLGDDYERLLCTDQIEEMCALLAKRVVASHAKHSK
jgi:hypothetical protein